jgi:opacity protein-like surface antigen
MNLVAKAGLAAAAITFAAAAAMPASAADLGGWGRGSIKDDRIHAPRSAASPCYFRADVGYSGSTTPGLRWTGDTDPDPASTYLSDVVRNTSMDATWTGGVGLGCGSGSRGFRYEFMLGYHGERALAGRTVPFDYAGDYTARSIHSGITSYTGMVNGYFDLGNIRGFVPYVGLGVGLAYHQMDDYRFEIPGPVPFRVSGDNDLTLAWSAMAGFAYQVSDRAILDFGYRYIDLGRAATSRTDNFSFTPSKLSVDDMGAHEFKIGLRYHLGNDGCCAATSHIPMK